MFCKRCRTSTLLSSGEGVRPDRLLHTSSPTHTSLSPIGFLWPPPPTTTCMSHETCVRCDVNLPTDTCLMCLVLKGVEGRSCCCFGANLSPWTGAHAALSLCSGSDMWKKERKSGAEPFTEDRSAVKASQSEEVTLAKTGRVKSTLSEAHIFCFPETSRPSHALPSSSR